MAYGVHLLDTSALFKLIVYPDLTEAGSKELYEFRRSNANFHTLDLCVGEALQVLKRKAFLEKSKSKLNKPDGYLICVNRLLSFVRPQHSIHLIETNLSELDIKDFTGLVKKYDIDVVDALVILKARSQINIKSLLITADKGMEDAARALNLHVWNCAQADAPAPLNMPLD